MRLAGVESNCVLQGVAVNGDDVAFVVGDELVEKFVFVESLGVFDEAFSSSTGKPCCVGIG